MSDWPTGMVVRPIDTWPGTLHRPYDRRRSPFSASWATTLSGLVRELDHLDATHPVVQMAVTESMIRADGTGVLASARPEHPGVVLAMGTKHGPLRYACDTYTEWRDNLRGIVLTLDALRRVTRYGAVSAAEQYQGWRQIEGQGSAEQPMTREMARKILADLVTLPEGVGYGSDLILKHARVAAHPDRNNGDRRLWDNVEQAARVLGIAS